MPDSLESVADKPVALIIDDEKSICESLAGVLSDEGWSSVVAFSGFDGLRKFRTRRPDLVLLDVWMAGMDGIETLQKIKEFSADVPVVIMSGHATIDTAVRATKLGAFDFLEKPLSIDKLLPMLAHASEIKIRASLTDMTDDVRYRIIGQSKAINDIKCQIDRVAPKNAWVLLTGENGTGKEVVAQNIHVKSTRSKAPFVAVNCAAIPEQLIESELFGHAKGAYTGAVSSKKGKFELAHRGTIFLDEIADMSLKTQAKILRILQEQEFERLGDDETIQVDVRVIAATNKPLSIEIEQGRFREDLFYRLNVIPFALPPLREREEDAILLAHYFLEKCSASLKEDLKVLSSEVKSAFLSYPWPGNVRELQNLIERLCIMVPQSEIQLSDLPESFRIAVEAKCTTGTSGAPDLSRLKEARSEFERSFILGKLEENQWNVTKTAEAIGIERSNLHRKLKALQIDGKKILG